MQLFLDGSDIEKIRKYCGLGLIDGVTTNPSIILKSGKNMIEVISGLAGIVSGSVSAEVSALDSDTMVHDGGHSTARASAPAGGGGPGR